MGDVEALSSVEVAEDLDKENKNPSTNPSQKAVDAPISPKSVDPNQLAEAASLTADEHLNKLFRQWKLSPFPVAMRTKWRRLDEIILHLGHNSIECFCRGREETAYYMLAASLSQLLRSIHAKNPALATEALTLRLSRTLQAETRRMFPVAVSSFREKVYEVFDDFLSEVDENKTEEDESQLESQQVLLKKLKAAIEMNKALAEQRAKNAGMDLVLAQLDIQIKSYAEFTDFLDLDMAGLENAEQAENNVQKTSLALKQHQELRNFKQRLSSGQ